MIRDGNCRRFMASIRSSAFSINVIASSMISDSLRLTVSMFKQYIFPFILTATIRVTPSHLRSLLIPTLGILRARVNLLLSMEAWRAMVVVRSAGGQRGEGNVWSVEILIFD